MIAYVHIGTVKTGTTTIQKFLFLNKAVLRNSGFLISEYFGAPIAYGKDEFFDSFANKNWEKYYGKNIINFYREIDTSKANNILISSEGLHAHLLCLEDVVRFRNFLLSTKKISKIKIIVYLREPSSMAISLYSELVKNAYTKNLPTMGVGDQDRFIHDCNYKTLKMWINVFGKENVLIRLFDQEEFYQGDLLKDFVHSLGLKWDKKFIIPLKQNESLDLIGIKLFSLISQQNTKNGILQLWHPFCKYFHSKDSHLRFKPSKEVVQSYIDYFEESNEWVRKEFFPHKERLFPKKDLSDYKENYELKEMKPEYWDKIAEFIADIIKTKNQAIQNKDNQIISTNNEKQKLIDEKSNLQTQINQLQNTLNALPIKKQQLEISNLEQDLINKKLNAKETNQNILIKELEIKKLEQELNINQAFSYIPKEQSAKQRVHDHLSYKLGQAMIVNSKSFLGYIRMPFVLSYIHDKHKQEQKIYQEKIKKDPFLKLPPLESYPDYKEALKEKECLTYKLGEALIKASNNWYGGGVYQIVA
ncbi:TPA: hypothetical protein SEZ58_001511 [Campylobacter coli]|nr:hypothetical protein [Campylobacter coli]